MTSSSLGSDSDRTLPTVTTLLKTADQTARLLSAKTGMDRSRAVQAMAQALNTHQNDLLEANTLDLEISREMAIPELLLDWIKLTPERIQSTVQLLHRLSDLPDPIGRIMVADFPVDQCQTYSQRMPLGVVAFIHEAFPHLGMIAAGLCIKTGNCLVLKGGPEASHSNGLIAEILRSALSDANFSPDSVQIVPDEGSSLRDLVTQDRYLNLVIPYGRPSLVQQVMHQATAPVLKSALGNCCLYWSPSGSLEMARWMILESHLGEPDPINAIEQVLVNAQQNPSSLKTLWNHLRDKGFDLRGDERLVAEFAELKLASESEWGQASLDGTIRFRSVQHLSQAIAWMNQHSSGHADCLVTESYSESRKFAIEVNSASIYINASPRFYRNPKRGDVVFLGMSNQKGHRRGAIGLETLTTVKHIVQG